MVHQAGVSKGGLLYHFLNKDGLMTGMVEQLIQDFETALQAEFFCSVHDWLVTAQFGR